MPASPDNQSSGGPSWFALGLAIIALIVCLFLWAEARAEGGATIFYADGAFVAEATLPPAAGLEPEDETALADAAALAMPAEPTRSSRPAGLAQLAAGLGIGVFFVLAWVLLRPRRRAP
ncbi:hypothetical protein [Maricaulis sp. CAU 1757]